MEQIENICFNILVQTPGVNRVILADKTGLTLVHTSRFDFDLRDVESMGAISSAVYLASEQQGFNVGLKDMNTLVAEFKSGKILVADCVHAVLCLITDNDVPLGMARMTINQAAKQIEELLDEIIEQDVESMQEQFDTSAEAPAQDPMAMLDAEMPGQQEMVEQQQNDEKIEKQKKEEEEEEEDEFLEDLQSALRELENF